MPILYSIVDFYNLNDQDKNENGMLSAGDKQKIYRYFDFVTINDFDKDGQFCSEDRILLRKGSRLFDIINGRDLITLKTGEKTITLPISKNRICQNYITGQNMIASGNIYHIINISQEAGTIEARLATGGMNTEVYHYVQARTYRISATGHELLLNNHILLKRSLNGITITDAYLTVMRTPQKY